MSTHHFIVERDVDRAERLSWMEAFEAGEGIGQLCARFGISQPTFRKWFRRYRLQGLAGLDEPSRRPVNSPNRKVFEREERAILALRAEGLGIQRIRAALARDGIALSTDTILKVLRRAGEPPLRPRQSVAREAEIAVKTMSLTMPAAGLPTDATVAAARPDPGDALADAIAQWITDGRFRPGEKLSENHLAGLLGVGRAAVRAALQRLAPGGLVVLERNRGAFVNNPSIPEVEQAYAARRLIEGEIVADVCRHCTAHDVRMLRRHVGQQAEAERAGDRGSLVRLLTEFHVLLATLGENRALEEFVRTLSQRTSLAVLLYDHVGSSCAIEEHDHLIDLMAAGDEAGARALMDQHLTTNRGRLLQASSAGTVPAE